MDAVIQTKLGPKSLHVCKDGSFESTEWISIYEEAFPPGQRQDLDELKQQLVDGRMELDETRDADNNILCMTITEVFAQASTPEFLLACYTAVVPEMRGVGIGSIHRSRLDSLLLNEYPDFIGIVSEIESTRESDISPEAMHVRVKRKSFFMKLGLVPLDIDYRFPSYKEDEEPIAGELLWVPFNNKPMDPALLAEVVKRIYVEGYKLEPDHALIAQVIDTIGKTPST
jgi:hypothetical protein